MPRKRKQAEQLPDPCGRRFCRFPAQWDEISQHELERMHAMSKLLVAGRLPRDYLKGSSTGSLFDP